MADEAPVLPSRPLIADRYAVDTSQILPEAGGGLPAYLARDQMAADGKKCVAIAVSRNASPRLEHLKTLNEPIDGLMVPLGHGIAPMADGRSEGYFVICPTPPGPPLSASSTVWSERALIEFLLRPVAVVLDAVHARKLTHRAIRPNNVFQSSPGQPVTLGAAWAAPPAMHQPSVFESPYTAMCHPACRGDGVIADDIYALGILLLTLSAGRVPMANMDADTIVRWKLDLGSFAALSRDIPLSGFLADLLRVMLAEDPDHRPPPNMLMELVQSRGRRVAARPGRRGQSPLMMSDHLAIFDPRTLAWALHKDPKKAIQFLRNGQLSQWLRRGLGDATLATQIEELIRARVAEPKPTPFSDPFLVMHTISALNPRMPLCWRGLALWPDALPSMLAEGIASDSELLATFDDLMFADILDTWHLGDPKVVRPDPIDVPIQRQLLKGGGVHGLLRLFYWMNPLLPCRVPAMASAWVSTVPELMEFFERFADAASETLIDPYVAAFIAARADRKTEIQVTSLCAIKEAGAFLSAELSLLRHLQARYHPDPMPVLAKWVAARLRPEIDLWRNKAARTALHERLNALIPSGSVARLLDLTSDADAWAVDVEGLKLATYALSLIEEELSAIDDHHNLRSAHNERVGEAITGGIGLSAFILMMMMVTLR